MILAADNVLAGNYIVWWLAQIAAVVILVILFLRWRPGFLGSKTIKDSVAQALSAREAQIRHQLEAAQRSREEAARIRAEAEEEIERARAEGKDIVARAAATSEAIKTDMHERAQEEYQRIIDQARSQIDYERQQAELALRRRAADVVVDAAREVLERNYDVESDRRLVNDALGSMRDLR